MLEFHPIANCWRLIEGDRFDELVEDVRKNGLIEPIVIFENKILDGRNRFRACEIAGITPEFVAYGKPSDFIEIEKIESDDYRFDPQYRAWIGNEPYDPDSEEDQEGFWAEYKGDLEDPIAFAKSLNEFRRHDDESQRSMTAARLANLPKGRPIESETLENSSMELFISQERAADMMGVSVPSVKRARVVVEKGSDELIEAVERGEVSVRAAADVATLPKPQQSEIVARGEKEILEAAKQIRTEKAEARRAEIAKLKEDAPPLPDGQYSVIVIDPPWQMEKIERDVRPNQVSFDYPTMDEAELAAFGVPSIAGADCHLYCWTTHKHLPMALRLVEAWGFRYVMTHVWHKPGGFQPIGLPQYNCEFVIYARKGSPQFTDTKSFFACFEAPRREHSRKPDEFYDLIRRVTDGPRIDVFCRETREGFDQFGNEADKFSGAA